jgi:hypothetical protein
MDFDLVKGVKISCVLSVVVLLADLHLAVIVELTSKIDMVSLFDSKIVARA